MRRAKFWSATSYPLRNSKRCPAATFPSRSSGESSAGGGRQQGSGAGESDLDLDRRKIRDRIAELKEQLEDIQRDNDQRRSARRDQLRVALVGYTNAGKSSLMRAPAAVRRRRVRSDVRIAARGEPQRAARDRRGGCAVAPAPQQDRPCERGRSRRPPREAPRRNPPLREVTRGLGRAAQDDHHVLQSCNGG